MDEKSTPIDQLRDGGGQQGNSELVQNILNDYEQGDQPPQVPPQQMPPPPQGGYEEYGGQDGYGEQYQDDYEYEYVDQPKSVTDNLIDEVKGPLLAAVLFFVFSQKMLDKALIQNIAKLSTDGELNLMGLGLKALLVGVVFYVVKKFVL